MHLKTFKLGIDDNGFGCRFYSFCRVGTGLTGDESEHLVNKLKPYFRQNKKNDKPPSFYVVTNAAKERPDVWIEQPEKWVTFFTFLIIVFVNSWSLLISLSINWVAAI
jgi:ATP-dependent DNA ligase